MTQTYFIVLNVHMVTVVAQKELNLFPNVPKTVLHMQGSAHFWQYQSQIETRLEKMICVFNFVLSFSLLSKWHNVFMILQGENLELENVLSEFKMCHLFCCCLLLSKVKRL